MDAGYNYVLVAFFDLLVIDNKVLLYWKYLKILIKSNRCCNSVSSYNIAR